MKNILLESQLRFGSDFDIRVYCFSFSIAIAVILSSSPNRFDYFRSPS